MGSLASSEGSGLGRVVALCYFDIMLWWIVEDAAFIRVILRRQLEKQFGNGLEVMEWQTADEAREAMADQVLAPQGIICDVVLPQQSGLSLLPHFSAQWPKSFVVMISSLPEEAWRAHVPSGGHYHAFLQKPFSVEQFVSILARFQQHRNEGNKEVA
jgi:DNA-binding NtrC family response regulator